MFPAFLRPTFDFLSFRDAPSHFIIASPLFLIMKMEQLLVSTTGTGFDCLTCSCVVVVAGVWSMLSFVQHLGRIRDKKQGKDAILHLLYVNDLSKAERKKFVESAKLSYTRLHENKLIGSTREYIMHCSPKS